MISFKSLRAAAVAFCMAWLGCQGGGTALAHDLPENRLTLVLRDDNHVSLTYFIEYVGVLHRALAPGRTLQEFVLAYAAMPPADFQKELARAHARFSGETRLALVSGEALACTGWRWPEPARAQALLQERAMQAVVGAGEHSHSTVIEVRAEARSSRTLAAITVRLPTEFGKVMVVSYQPKQTWVEPGAGPRSAGSTIKF